MKKFFLAFGMAAMMSPAIAQHKHGQEYNVSVFKNGKAARNNAAITKTDKIAQAAFPEWAITVDKGNGSLKDIYGPAITLPGNTNLERARYCMTEKLSGLGVKINEWVMYRDQQTDKAGWVDFEQVIDNHKVAFSRLGFRFSNDGKLVRVQMKNYGTPQAYTAPVLSGADALTAAAQNMAGANITASTIVGDWAWFPVPSVNGYELHPSWAFKISGTDLNKEEMQLKGYVDAITGEVLYRTNDVKFDYDLTVNGVVKVNGFAQPATVEPLANLKLTVNGGTQYTDLAGYFGNTTLNLPDLTTVTLEGKWSTVRDVPSNNTIPSVQQNVTLQGTTFTYPVTGVAKARHINAYYHVNKVHDYMKSHYPGFTGMDVSLITNVDLTNSSCNAFYNGSSINFYAAANNCNSFAEINDIVYHEYGHGINDKFYSQFGPSMNNGGLNEGYADVWAMCITDNPILGQYSTVGGGIIRRYDAAPKVYPADIEGEVHADGEIIAGAWWDVRENLGNIDTMAALFTGTLYDTPDGPDGTEGDVYHAVLISALQTDDDDNNINNGTPHFMAIVEGFAEHGIYLLSEAEVTHAEVLNQWENYTIPITATVQTTYQPFLKDVLLMYRERANITYTAVTMNNIGNSTFTAAIPAQTGTKIMDYYFVVRDTLAVANTYGPAGFDPTGAANKSNIPYQFGILLLGQSFEQFENSLAGWTIGNFTGMGMNPADAATSGKWIQALPVQASSNGTISQTGSDHTSGSGKCLVTGNGTNSSQGVGTADVDGGRTTVATPVINIAGLENPIIEYHRWYSNNAGSNPGTEKWETRIGTPTTVLWPIVESTYITDQSWRRRIFRVRDYIATGNEIQMLFIANDDATNGGCVVEAGIDDFIIYDRNWPTSIAGSPVAEKANIYPNPANETVNIILPANSLKSGTIGLYDLTGKKIQELQLENEKKEYQLNTHAVAAGTYFLMIQSDKLIQSQKITIGH